MIRTMDTTDEQLVRQYRDGHLEALDELIKRYTTSIYAFVYRLSGNQTEATDITQEVFIRVWKSLAQFDINRQFKTWLFTIARNTTIDWLRKKKNIPFSMVENEDKSIADNIPDLEPLPDEIFAQQEIKQNLEQILSTISVDSKTIILLHDIEGLTFEAIAKVVNKPMNTVKSQYRRALNFLRQKLVDVTFAPKL